LFDFARRGASTIPGRPGFDNFERSYSLTVHWARGTLACFYFTLWGLGYREFTCVDLNQELVNTLPHSI